MYQNKYMYNILKTSLPCVPVQRMAIHADIVYTYLHIGSYKYYSSTINIIHRIKISKSCMIELLNLLSMSTLLQKRARVLVDFNSKRFYSHS